MVNPNLIIGGLIQIDPIHVVSLLKHVIKCLIGGQVMQSLLYVCYLIHWKRKEKLVICVKYFLTIHCVSLFLIFSKASPAGDTTPTSPSSTAPNVKNVKQMLLDWCRAKTEPYEVNMAWLSLSVNYCSMEPYIALPFMYPQPPLFFSTEFLLPGGKHPEFLLQLGWWHSLLRLSAPLLSWCVRVLHPQSLCAQGKLPAGFQHCRVSSHSLYEDADVSCLVHALATAVHCR